MLVQVTVFPLPVLVYPLGQSQMYPTPTDGVCTQTALVPVQGLVVHGFEQSTELQKTNRELSPGHAFGSFNGVGSEQVRICLLWHCPLLIPQLLPSLAQLLQNPSTGLQFDPAIGSHVLEAALKYNGRLLFPFGQVSAISNSFEQFKYCRQSCVLVDKGCSPSAFLLHALDGQAGSKLPRLHPLPGMNT